MVVSGTAVGYPADDLNKLGWIARIAAFHHPVKLDSYFDRSGRINMDHEKANAVLLESLLYKLNFYNMHKIHSLLHCPVRMQSFKQVDTLNYFQSVFNTSNVIARIYKVKQ